MVERSTGKIYGIIGYGKIHKGHYYGTLDEIDQWYWATTTLSRSRSVYRSD